MAKGVDRTRHSLSLTAERRAEAFIEANLPLTEVPGTGVRLHLAGPRSGLSRLVPPDGTPYWAYAWPGGVALAMHLVTHPETVRGRMVHDIGMGSGLAAIAAMQAGAAGVVGFDTDPFAAVAARLNAQANGIPTFPVIPDIAGQQDPGQDHFRSKEGAFIVLAGDVFYDDEVASRMSAALDSAEASAEPDCHILVGDIGRGFLPRHRLEPLACYPVRDVGDPPGAPAREGWVYHWKSAWTEPAKRKGRPKGRPS